MFDRTPVLFRTVSLLSLDLTCLQDVMSMLRHVVIGPFSSNSYHVSVRGDGLLLAMCYDDLFLFAG